jgi:hypothetical protein
MVTDSEDPRGKLAPALSQGGAEAVRRRVEGLATLALTVHLFKKNP